MSAVREIFFFNILKLYLKRIFYIIIQIATNKQ